MRLALTVSASSSIRPANDYNKKSNEQDCEDKKSSDEKYDGLDDHVRKGWIAFWKTVTEPILCSRKGVC